MGILGSLVVSLLFFTVRSTCLLLRENKGLLVMCLMPYVCAKCVNSSASNSGPLSLLSVSGIPNLEKVAFIHSVTVAEVVLLSLSTSGYLEKYSTRRR